MSTNLALNDNVSLYSDGANNANGNTLDLNYQGNVVDWCRPLYPQPTYYWYPYSVVVERTTLITNGHRICSCPKCAGDCCDCADCRVKRLEKRVAELERDR